MKRMLAIFFGITMLLSVVGISNAAAKPGPDTGNSEKGLCTAYFNGQKKGHDKQKERNNEAPGPFAGLEDRAEDDAPRNNDGDDDTNVSGFAAVFDYCNSNFEIGGNPDHGRFDCTPDDPETEDEDEFNCERNDPPGNSGGNGG